MRFRVAESNSVIGLSAVTASDAVEAVNFRKLTKPYSKGVVDYKQQFVDGVIDLLSDGKTAQISFSEFVQKYAPTFDGKAKCVLDDVAKELSKKHGIVIQTTTTGNSPIRVDGSRGFKCCRAELPLDDIEEDLPL